MYPKTTISAHALPPRRSGLGYLWQTTLTIQTRFLTEYTNCLLSHLAKNQALVAEQMKRISSRGEQVASLMAHAAIRSLAIATHARHEEHDRRVFPLNLPRDRRSEVREDRRASPFRTGTARVISLR